jgi:outer membrane protein, heavy metal efflux system
MKFYTTLFKSPAVHHGWAAAIAMAVLSLPTYGHAEELERLVPDAQLTMSSVLQKTFERSPRQQVLQAEGVAVESRKLHADSALPGAPAVAMMHQGDASGPGHLTAWEAALEVPVWLPGQRAAREAVARAASGGLEANRAGLMLLVAGQLRDAVWDVAMNADAVDLAMQRHNTAEALQHDVERRQQAGELAKTDVLLVRNETLQTQTQLVRAQAELKHAEHRYWMLTGIKQLPANPAETLSAHVELNDQHPLLAEIAQRVALVEEERNLTRVQKRENPQVVVNARRELGAFDSEYNNSLGLALRIPLDSAVRSAPMMAGAEMAVAQAMSEREQLLLTLRTALHEAEHNLEVTRDELVIVEEQNRLMQENLQLAKKAFGLGESDLVSLLRVQALAYEAERALSSRKIQLQWDIARYNQAVGVLP